MSILCHIDVPNSGKYFNLQINFPPYKSNACKSTITNICTHSTITTHLYTMTLEQTF